jgi:hypothetical protein
MSEPFTLDQVPTLTPELHTMAAAVLAKEGGVPPLTPEELVEKALSRLIPANSNGSAVTWRDRQQFLAEAELSMWRALWDHTRVPLTPELRQWLLEQDTEEDLEAALRDMRENGGLELHEFLPELEQIVRNGERTD